MNLFMLDAIAASLTVFKPSTLVRKYDSVSLNESSTLFLKSLCVLDRFSESILISDYSKKRAPRLSHPGAR